jgi:hypothetical protein
MTLGPGPPFARSSFIKFFEKVVAFGFKTVTCGYIRVNQYKQNPVGYSVVDRRTPIFFGSLA